MRVPSLPSQDQRILGIASSSSASCPFLCRCSPDDRWYLYDVLGFVPAGMCLKLLNTSDVPGRKQACDGFSRQAVLSDILIDSMSWRPQESVKTDVRHELLHAGLEFPFQGLFFSVSHFPPLLSPYACQFQFASLPPSLSPCLYLSQPLSILL